ncbi:MAG: hypothetical protein KJ994_05745 [Candidatus Omnitrophica bacterium]|nr:hypothetical protein [Candidatus Omnitrophota bacterium]
MKSMLYFSTMVYHKYTLPCLFIAAILSLSWPGYSHCQEHIRKLDAVRASMAKMGSTLPELTRKAQTRDIRTMERVFEINNYSLVTIESYLKMTKIALTSETGLNKETLGVLIGWLKFLSNYCAYDIKYMDEALTQTKDASIIEILNTEKKNISALIDASQLGIKENTAISDKL